MRDDQYRAMFDLEDRLWWFSGMRAITESILASDPTACKRPTHLDVGCGTGYNLKWLEEKLSTAGSVGVDYSPSAASFWKERGLSEGVVASVAELPFVSGNFDLITCFDVIYQLTEEAVKSALNEMKRVLKSGGLIFIREPAFEWLRGSHDIAVSTHHRFTRKELVSLLEHSGFNVKRSTYANTLLLGPALAKRISSRIKKGDSSDVKPVNPVLNRILMTLMNIEAGYLKRFSFPVGMSVIAVAEKQK